MSLSGSAAWRVGEDDRVAPAVALGDPWGSITWRVVMAKAWRSEMPRAVGEVQAAEIAFRYSAPKVDSHGCRQLVLLDARSALGALAKGRSSAFGFLRILRRVTALSLAAGMEWHVRWVLSEDQPADAANRRFAPSSVEHDWTKSLPLPLQALLPLSSALRLSRSRCPAPRSQRCIGER